MNKLEWLKNFIVKSSSTKKCSNVGTVGEKEEEGPPPAHHTEAGAEAPRATDQPNSPCTHDEYCGFCVTHQCPPRSTPDQPCTHEEYCGFCAICSICYVKKYEEEEEYDVPDTCPCHYGSECIYCGFCTICREIQQIEEKGWLYNIYWRYCLKEKMRSPYRGFL